MKENLKASDASPNAIYVRTSAKKQEKGGGRNNQLDSCKALLSKHGCKDYRLFEDISLSGKILDRDGLNELRDEVKAGRIKTVATYTLDRLSRDGDGILELIDEFEG